MGIATIAVKLKSIFGFLATDSTGSVQANVVHRTGLLADLDDLVAPEGEIAFATDKKALVAVFTSGATTIYGSGPGGVPAADITTGVAGYFPAGTTDYTLPAAGNAVYASLAALLTYLQTCEYSNGSSVRINLGSGTHSLGAATIITKDLRHVTLAGAFSATLPIASVFAVDGVGETITLVYTGTYAPVVDNILTFNDGATAEKAKLIGGHRVTAVDTINKRVTLSFTGPALPVVAALAVNGLLMSVSIAGDLDINGTHGPKFTDYIGFSGQVSVQNSGVFSAEGATCAFTNMLSAMPGSSVKALYLYFGSGGSLTVNKSILSATNLYMGCMDNEGYTGFNCDVGSSVSISSLSISNAGASDWVVQAYDCNLSISALDIHHAINGVKVVGASQVAIETIYSSTSTVTNLLVDSALVPISRNRLYNGGFIVQSTTDVPSELPVIKQVAPSAKTVSATLTAAELLTRIIKANPGGAVAATYTMPLGTALQTALGTDFAVDDAFEFTVNNISVTAAETVTIAGNTGVTAIGSMTIAANSAAATNSVAIFRVRKTALNVFEFYKVA